MAVACLTALPHTNRDIVIPHLAHRRAYLGAVDDFQTLLTHQATPCPSTRTPKKTDAKKLKSGAFRRTRAAAERVSGALPGASLWVLLWSTRWWPSRRLLQSEGRAAHGNGAAAPGEVEIDFAVGAWNVRGGTQGDKATNDLSDKKVAST